MTNFFIKNKHKVARVISGKSGLKHKIFLGFNLLCLTFFIPFLALCQGYIATFLYFSVLIMLLFVIFVIFMAIVKLENKIWNYDILSKYKEVIDLVYDSTNQYVKSNINDEILIADPIFTIDTEISEEQFINTHKNSNSSEVGYSIINNYLKAATSKWLINSNTPENVHIISPFRITAICFLEYSVIFISQTTSLPTCEMEGFKVIEEKYLDLWRKIKIRDNEIIIGDFSSHPINQNVIKKLATIFHTITPCMSN